MVALDEALRKEGERSRIFCCPNELGSSDWDGKEAVVAHGLWHWPTRLAPRLKRSHGNPYFIFPHGMLDPWFRKNSPLKHWKKQIYWWFFEGRAVRRANALCFTTDEEMKLARRTFSPYRCREEVVGLGVGSPPEESPGNRESLLRKLSLSGGKRILLYLGRFHPKKGVDLLIEAWLKRLPQDGVLVLAGPLEPKDRYLQELRKRTEGHTESIVWPGMLEGPEKWSMLRLADALILPSHQENFGMVVAEALAVGKPVYLTNKVNLWREVDRVGAGLVAKDDQAGIDELIDAWERGPTAGFVANALNCFDENFHIRAAARKLIGLAQDPVE